MPTEEPLILPCIPAMWERLLIVDRLAQILTVAHILWLVPGSNARRLDRRLRGDEGSTLRIQQLFGLLSWQLLRFLQRPLLLCRPGRRRP